MNWSQFESIPFAVVAHSHATGWHIVARPQPENAWANYDAQDYQRKMLLNYGMIITQTDAARELMAA